MTNPSCESILRRGVLPENLPPIFSTQSLWSYYSPFDKTYLVTRKCVGALSPDPASKRGGQRRVFSLPHPTFIYDQAVFFEKHWAAIATVLSRANGSLSKPAFSETASRSARITPHSDLPRERLKAFSRSKYCLVTDVARCFPSIYTHSIPWAIHTRKIAKGDRDHASSDVFGNRLDFVIRQAQDGQTIGIPIGPDTSRLICELVLSAADESFLSRSGKHPPTYLRHVDDYWIGGHSIEECQQHLQNLRAALREYELDINELKTRIVPTSRVFGDTWPTEFDSEIQQRFGPFLEAATHDVVSTLSKFVDRAISDNDDGMIRHVIRKLDEHFLWDRHWDVLEHFLAQCAVQFPHSFDYVARVVAWRLRVGKEIDRNLWADVTRRLLVESSRFSRDSEVLWALWLLKELKIKITQAMSKEMVERNCDLVLGCLAHMHAHGLTTDKEITAQLWSRVEGSSHYAQPWPLSLELNHLEVPGGPLATGGEESLRMLHDKKVSLIDWNAAPKVFDADPSHSARTPSRAIEDFTSDYGVESDSEDGPEETDPETIF